MRLNRSLQGHIRLRATQTEFTLRPPLTLLPARQFQTFLLTTMNLYDTRGRTEVGYRFRLKSDKDFEQWFLARIDLFLEVTVASVQAMMPLPETWMLFVDEEMPDFTEHLRRKVAHIPYVALCPVPRPIAPRVSGYYSRTSMAQHIAARLRSDARYVMTTLLDNDDGLHREYIKNALFYAGLLTPKELEATHIINFPHGLKWNRDYIYPITLYSNPYLSLVEPAAWYKDTKHSHLTGYQRRHGTMNQCAVLHDIPLTEPMWLRLYHEANTLKPLFNEEQPQPLDNIKHLLGHFGLQHLAPSARPYAYALAAKNLMRVGDRQEATPLLQKAQRLSPDWAVLAQEEARLWEAEGNIPSAVEAYRRWVALAKEHPFTLFEAGLACLRMGEIDHGRDLLEKAFAKQPGLSCEQIELAPQVMDALHTHHPNWAWFWYQQGLAYAQQKKHKDALAAFQRAMELAPSWPEPYSGAAQAAFDCADYSSARAIARKGSALHPLWPQLHHLIGKSFMREQRWAEAAAALFKATEQHLDQDDPNYDLAISLAWLGRIDEAEISIGDALLFDSERVERLYEFAELLKARGHGRKAKYWEDLARRLLP